MERSRRVTNVMGLEVKVHHHSTPLPRQWDKYICNPKNKTAFITFISNYLVDKARSSLQPGTFWSLVVVYKKMTRLSVFEVGTHPLFEVLLAIMKKQTHVCHFILLMRLICYQGL